MMWISDEIFSWHPQKHRCAFQAPGAVARTMQLWSHADQLLQKDPNRNQRADSITNLKRCIDSRVKALDEIYFLKNIPLPELPRDKLEILKCFDLVRPLLLEKLYQIRNSVEHEDTEPPTAHECKELSEFVWYFLRSTEQRVLSQNNSILFCEDKEINKRCAIEFGLWPGETWKLNGRAWLTSQYISKEQKDGWLVVVESKEKYKSVMGALHEEEGRVDISFDVRGTANHIYTVLSWAFLMP